MTIPTRFMIYMLKNKILWKGGMQKILKKQAHLNKVLKAVLNTNQLIGKESDPACLIQKACEELIGTMGYFNAWIGLLDEEGRHVGIVDGRPVKGQHSI